MSQSADQASAPRAPVDGVHTRRTVAKIVLLVALAVSFVGLILLGIWQLERRAWKLDLIERVDARVHAAPLAPPGPGEWPTLSAGRDEYRNVAVSGRFLHGRDTQVQAVTVRGAGFWLLTPLQREDGSVVLVNRGFVPPGWTGAPDASSAPPEVRVTGLLRLSEPGGGFLRSNAPALSRWYSRDVQAIATAQGLDRVAPYFIDAAASNAANGDSSSAEAVPVGGLTVVSFRNHHMQYALTWFAMALMVVGAAWLVVRDGRRRPIHP